MEILIQGLKISTQCEYVKFTKSQYLEITEEVIDSIPVFHIKFPSGFLNTNIIHNQISVIEEVTLTETDYVKIENPIINIGGFKFTKLTNNPYTFSQFIVDDIDKFIIDFDEQHCTILIPSMFNYRVDKYKCIFDKNPYLKRLNDLDDFELRNLYGLRILDKDVGLNPISNFKFNSKKFYTKYIIDSIDYIDSFIEKLEKIVSDFGFELIRLPIDSKAHSVDRITYRYTEIGKQTSRKTDYSPMRFIVDETAHIEFKITTPNISKFMDFRNRYQNLDIISDFTQFYTKDKLGRNWISSVFWSPLDTSFMQDYSQDEQGNYALEAGFSADMSFSIMYDEAFYKAHDIIISILEGNNTLTI